MKLIRVVIASVVLGSLGMTSLPAHAQTSALAQANSLSQTRSAAVLKKDQAAFTATIDPQAPRSFKDAQVNLFKGLTSLPLSAYKVVATEDNSGDMAPGLNLKDKYKADNAYLPETRVSYRLGQYDDRDDVDTYWYTYVQRGGNWYVAGDGDAAALGLDSARKLWDGGSLSAQSNARVLVLTTTSNAARGSALLATAADALSSFDLRWTLPWNDRVVLIDPGTADEAQRILQQSGNIADFAAFTTYTPLRDTGWTTTAPRVYAQDTNLAKESTELQRQTLVHEFTHYAEAQLAGPFTPTWLHEGTAEWLRLNKPSATNPVVAKPKLPVNSDFVSANGTTVQQAYKSATSAVAFAQSLKGSSAPTDLFSSIGARRLSIGSPAYNIDKSLQTVTGLDTGAFVAAWDSRYAFATSTDSALTPAS